jgi:hypothetical protein
VLEHVRAYGVTERHEQNLRALASREFHRRNEVAVAEDRKLQGAADPQAGANPLTLFPRTDLVFLTRPFVPARKL